MESSELKIPKKKIAARIFLNNDILIRGVIHLFEEERLADFINNDKRAFIPIAKEEVCVREGANFIKVASDLIAKEGIIVLNKSSVCWIEEEK
jgi:hypothetical protein